MSIRADDLRREVVTGAPRAIVQSQVLAHGLDGRPDRQMA